MSVDWQKIMEDRIQELDRELDELNRKNVKLEADLAKERSVSELNRIRVHTLAGFYYSKRGCFPEQEGWDPQETYPKTESKTEALGGEE